jgi:hypothetical protein
MITMDGSQISFEGEIKSQEKFVVSDEMTRQASQIVREQYISKYGDEDENAPDIIINNIAMATTLRRINRDLDTSIVKSLGTDVYNDFLLDTHALLTGKEKPRTKKNMIDILRRHAGLRDRDRESEQRLSGLDKNIFFPNFESAVKSTLLSVTIKEGGNYSDVHAEKVARFVMAYMPYVAKNISQECAQNKIKESLFLSEAPMTVLEKALVMASEYVDFGEGDVADHVDFAVYQEKQYLRAKIDAELQGVKKVDFSQPVKKHHPQNFHRFCTQKTVVERLRYIKGLL